MVFIDWKDFILVGIIGLIILYFLFMMFVYNPVKALIGYKLYQYEKILSVGGIARKTMWHKNDKDALKEYRHYDFVEIIYPPRHKRKFCINQQVLR